MSLSPETVYTTSKEVINGDILLFKVSIFNETFKSLKDLKIYLLKKKLITSNQTVFDYLKKTGYSLYKKNLTTSTKWIEIYNSIKGIGI